MKYLADFLIVLGILFIMSGILFCVFCFLASDPEIEGESGRTGLGSYLLSLIPIGLGILFFILSHKIKRNKISD